MFENVKITKNADPNKYFCSGYGIGFDTCSHFSVPNFGWGANVIIFGVHISSSVHDNNKNEDILIFVKGQTQGLDNTTITAEAEYSINFFKITKKFCLSLHYNGSKSFLFVNGIKIYQFKAKDSEIKRYTLYLENISKIFSVDNMKKTRLKGYVYDFSVDYNDIAVDDIPYIHNI